MKITLLQLSILFNFSTCRDFYLGMFKKNDLLISQDTLYKERVPYKFTTANYGRKYNCPITYIRVLDRLNIGRGPRVQIIRGGLRKTYIVLRLTSPYNNPISVNIMVGCENKKHTRPPWKIIRPTTKRTTVHLHKTTKTKSKHIKTTTKISTKKKTEHPSNSETTAVSIDEATKEDALEDTTIDELNPTETETQTNLEGETSTMPDAVETTTGSEAITSQLPGTDTTIVPNAAN